MTDVIAKTHALVRTNKFGVPFVGRCIQCGARNLPAAAARWHCKNPKMSTQAESLLEVIES
jgi:hypothetical protein